MKFQLLILKEDLSIVKASNIENNFIRFAEELLSSGKLDNIYNITKKVKINVTEDNYFFESDNLEKLFLDLAYFIDKNTYLSKIKEKEKELGKPKWNMSSQSLGDSAKYFPNIEIKLRKIEITNTANILGKSNHKRELLVKKIFSF